MSSKSINWYGLNRTLCDVLEDMRRLMKHVPASLNSALSSREILLSLIEEAQVLGNRMEAGLDEQKDLESLHQEISTAKDELRKLRIEVKDEIDK